MKVTLMPIVMGAFCTVTKRLVQGMEYLEIRGQEEIIQTTVLLGWAKILVESQETWRALLSTSFQWKTISQR